MKKTIILILFIWVFGFSVGKFTSSNTAFAGENLAKKLTGKILLAVEDKGKTYYVHEDGNRYRITVATAQKIFEKLAMGITNKDLAEIPIKDVGINPEGVVAGIKIEKETIEINKFQEIKNNDANQFEIKNNTISDNTKILNLKKYLEKLEQELITLDNEYNKLVSGINSENNTYKQKYEDNIKSADNKYQEDVNRYKPNHDYWVNYYQHQIDLEQGMGLRADKEQIKRYQNKLNLENTNFNNLIAKLQNDRNNKKSQYKSNYDNQLLNTSQRLNTITETYDNAKADRDKLKKDILEEIILLEK